MRHGRPDGVYNGSEMTRETLAVTDQPASPQGRHLQCTEVWGGNHFVDSEIEVAGLELRVYSKPHGGGTGGGDVHYVSTCSAGRISRVVVADVCGHGADVAQVATILRTLLRRYVIFHDQRLLVRSINRRFTRLTESGCFATAVVATFDAADRRLRVSNAGHPPPVHYAAATGGWAYLAKPESAAPGLADIPLGIDGVVRYGQASVRLAAGDMVLFYTDALVEGRGPGGRLIGQDGLLALVRELDPSAPRALVGELLSRVEALSPGNLARDDTTALLLRATGERPPTPLATMAMAPVRLVRSVVGSYLAEG